MEALESLVTQVQAGNLDAYGSIVHRARPLSQSVFHLLPHF